MDKIQYRCDLCRAWGDHKTRDHVERPKLKIVPKEPPPVAADNTP